MYRDDFFEMVWKILFSDKKDQVDCSDPEIRGIIRRMKRTLTTTEPDNKSMWKKFTVYIDCFNRIISTFSSNMTHIVEIMK